MKAIKITGLVYLAAFIWLCVIFGLFIMSMKTSPGLLGFDIVLYNFYYYGGIPLVLIFCVIVFSFIGKKAASLYSVYFLWAAMLFAFNYSAQVFPNMFNLKMMTFMSAFIWMSEFIPSMILTAVLVALLSLWNKEDKKVSHAIAWVGLLFSAFMAAYVIYYVLTASDFLTTQSVYSGSFQITHAIILPIAIAWFFLVTREKEYFFNTFNLTLPEVEKGK